MGTEDRIIIRQLSIHANHGVLPEEKQLGQRFLVNLELSTSMRSAAKNDDLEQTTHYGELCWEVQRFFTENTFDLIESCAEELAEHILLTYPLIRQVTAEVQKPWAPIGLPLEYAAVKITRGWHNAYIAFGSNVGDRTENIKQAIDAIGADKRNRITACSSFYETKPVGYADQGDFMNGAVRVETLLPPHELLSQLLQIELDLKRVRTVANGPRTIDLDILLYDDLITTSPDLVIPHPRMQDRLFVLDPLSEIAPHEVHPLLNKWIADLRESLL